MTRVKSLVTAGLLAGSLMLASIGAASADAMPNDNSGNGPQRNCVAMASAVVTHNGHAATLGANASHGERGDEIKRIHENCPS